MMDSETTPHYGYAGNPSALIFDIKRYAINDGPGIRIVIFFKGCNLKCSWCHNPEGIAGSPEWMYSPTRCILCSTCIEACSEGALQLMDSAIVRDISVCRLSGDCVVACPSKAIEMSGSRLTEDEIMTEILKEKVFFDQSGGGVTFSGGEPLLSPDLLIRLLDACGRMGIHRAIDTAGHVNTELLLEVARRTDLFLYDLKMMDSERHRHLTGVPNGKILQNLEILAKTGVPIIVRIPLMGGVNDCLDNLTRSAEFVSTLHGEKKLVQLLPYHKIAQTKYARLGRAEGFRLFEEPGVSRLSEALSIFQEFGITAEIGG